MKKFYYKCLNCNSETILDKYAGEFSYDCSGENHPFEEKAVRCPWCSGNMKRLNIEKHINSEYEIIEEVE